MDNTNRLSFEYQGNFPKGKSPSDKKKYEYMNLECFKYELRFKKMYESLLSELNNANVRVKAHFDIKGEFIEWVEFENLSIELEEKMKSII